jgi:predicted nucleic acid-binding protein
VLTAIDSNVLSALWSKEPAHTGMKELLFRASQLGGLLICAPVYAELLAYPGASKSFVDGFLDDTHITVDFELSKDIWIVAGKTFAAYAERRRKAKAGQPKRLLVDFVVGAHAQAVAERLLTLDAERYRSAFSKLRLVTDKTSR